MSNGSVFLLSLLSLTGLLVACGKTETPAKTVTNVQSTAAQTPQQGDGPIKPITPGDDQPVTVIGGSVVISSSGEWAEIPFTESLYYKPTVDSPKVKVYGLEIFRADDSDNRDYSANLVLSGALNVEIYGKKKATLLYKLTTDANGYDLTLRPQNKNPRKFRRHVVRKNENIDKLVISPVKLAAGSTLPAGCNIPPSSTVLTCTVDNGNDEQLGFTLHTMK